MFVSDHILSRIHDTHRVLIDTTVERVNYHMKRRADRIMIPSYFSYQVLDGVDNEPDFIS